ncbi:hypothetical protein ACN27F_20815 [Solwaraspora sp. WMMB335]|uniref:hypothetical protein n=1 Tax=Solwaraspora sp. WMMB335 TaxID=3404118 RepID=UPI003B93370B
MDALDLVAGPAIDLLARVDERLTRCGAPAEHPVWPLLRQVRALPGDAVGAFLSVRPAPWTDADIAIRPHLDGYAQAADALVGPLDWTGAAAQAYDATRSALAAQLAGRPDAAPGADPDSHAGRLAATAGFAEALARWAQLSRAALAGVLAGALSSADAITVVAAVGPAVGAGEAAAARAAAAVAVPVLRILAEIGEDGENLLARWQSRVAPAGPGGAPAQDLALRPDAVLRLRY